MNVFLKNATKYFSNFFLPSNILFAFYDEILLLQQFVTFLKHDRVCWQTFHQKWRRGIVFNFEFKIWDPGFLLQKWSFSSKIRQNVFEIFFHQVIFICILWSNFTSPTVCKLLQVWLSILTNFSSKMTPRHRI